ncbi:MAG TPA: FecR domain-containing protein, partial [Anseongella sp.]|nr:FecR domain-containing protein [Anseongella sp.]
EVWLEGEAFFKIRKMPGRESPEFYVHVGRLTIEVLGTSFNVYNRDDKTSVVLQEGSVELSSRDKTAVPGTLLMKPGDKVDIRAGGYEIEKVSVEPYISWKDNRMVFENLELSEIARMLEDNYGYRTDFRRPELKTLRFTGSYPAGNVDIFLKAIEEAFGIRIIKEEKTITFQ